jgi:disulfide bond formation protein DsbB
VRSVSVATVQRFYGVLALAAIVAVVIILGLRLGGRVSEPLRAWSDRLSAMVAPNALGLAWFVALLATAGSLYFSEIAGFDPCRLCWYQRIAMYPLIVILAIAAAFRDRGGAKYGIALAAVGAVIAAYHVALEWIPALDTGACDPAAPCTLVWFREFGFISLPTLALTAFVLIIVILTTKERRRTE